MLTVGYLQLECTEGPVLNGISTSVSYLSFFLTSGDYLQLFNSTRTLSAITPKTATHLRLAKEQVGPQLVAMDLQGNGPPWSQGSTATEVSREEQPPWRFTFSIENKIMDFLSQNKHSRQISLIDIYINANL